MLDAAEIEWGDLGDRRDMLRLLAAVSVGLGGKDLKDYTPASEKLADHLYKEPETPEERRLKILALSAAAGGEVS